MSMGGCYVAIHKDKLNELLDDENVSLSEFVFEEANAALMDKYSLEQAWDAFRHLFMEDIPELLGEEPLEDTDLGEGCFLICAEDVANIAAQLAAISAEDLKARFESEEFQTADFYWDNVWREDFDAVAEMFEGLVKYFAAAAQRGDAMLFYIG